MKIKIPVFIFLAALLIACSCASYCAVPDKVNYEGRLTNQYGTPESGIFTMTFALYDSDPGGTKIWPAGSPPGYSVTVNSGIFNVLLGSNGDSVTPSVFTASAARYLEVTVNGETLAPRTQIVSVGYSIKASDADTLAGSSPSSFTTVSTFNSHTAETFTAHGGFVSSVSSSGATALTGPVVLKAGSSIALSQSGSNITISSTGLPGTGTVTLVDTTGSLTGGPVTSTGTLDVAAGGITAAKLASNAAVLTFAKQGQARLTGNVDIKGGSNITLTQSGQTIDVSAAAGTGTVTLVNTTGSLTGGPVTSSGTLDVAANGITADKMDTGSVTSDAILDGTIVNNDIAVSAGIDYQKLNLSGSIVNGDITNGTITGGKIAGNTITAANMASNSVTQDAIAAGTPGANQLLSWNGTALAWVSPASIPSVEVDNITIDNNTFGSHEVKAGGLDATRYQTGSVTSGAIADNTIVNADVNSVAAISYSKLNLAGSIVNGDITSGTITGGKIAGNTITAANMASNSVTQDAIAAGAPASGQFLRWNGSVLEWASTNANPSTEVDNLTIDNTVFGSHEVKPGGLDASRYATGSVTSGAIADNTITAADLSNNSVTQAAIAAGTPASGQFLRWNGSALDWASTNANPSTEVDNLTIDNTVFGSHEVKPGGLDASRYATGSVTSGAIAANTITAANLANGSVTSGAIAVNGIKASNMGTGSVTSDAILDGTIVGADLSSSINISTTGSVTAGSFSGNGAALTNTPAYSIKTATTLVTLDSATAPTSGQYLMASNSSAAAWQIPITSEVTAGVTASLTTTANQKVVVWAKGDIVPGVATRTITLQYNAVVKDTVIVVETNNAGRRFPFSLMYTESPGAATHNITVNTSGGTLADVVITVLKINN